MRVGFELDAKRYQYPDDGIVEGDVHHEFCNAAVVEETTQRVEGRIADFDIGGGFGGIAHHGALAIMEYRRGLEVGEMFELLALDADLQRDVPVMREFVL